MAYPSFASVAGKPSLWIGNYDVSELGYAMEEFFVSGQADAYTPEGILGADGSWPVTRGALGPYKTRVVVFRPPPEKFNGAVLVEWLNVTGGIESPADWLMAHREIVRSGYAYVAVSAQKAGIDGGLNLVADNPLKKIDPIRYATLEHPGDAFAFDIFSQVGRAMRGPQARALLGPVKPTRVIAIGESQSALYLTTYINAVDPLAKVFDGFLVHSRFADAAPLDGRSIFEPAHTSFPAAPRFRPDLRAPVMNFITETDLIGGVRPGYAPARQPDTDRLRTWEVAGAAHADNYTVQVSLIDTGTVPIEQLAAAYEPTRQVLGMTVDKTINFGPQHHYAVQAALARLREWIDTGKAPPSGQPLLLESGEPLALACDADGLALGGVRTPWVDVPVARYAGGGNGTNPFLDIFGLGEPFDPKRLAALYPGGRADYLAKFEKALDSTIAAGFLLCEDRVEILALAAATYPPDSK